MDEKTTMGQPLRSMEDEETIDLMELARLLWAHIVQIVAAAVAAALICLLVCMFVPDACVPARLPARSDRV